MRTVYAQSVRLWGRSLSIFDHIQVFNTISGYRYCDFSMSLRSFSIAKKLNWKISKFGKFNATELSASNGQGMIIYSEQYEQYCSVYWKKESNKIHPVALKTTRVNGAQFERKIVNIKHMSVVRHHYHRLPYCSLHITQCALHCAQK